MESAYREAEKAMIAAKAIASEGGNTTDPGFLEAKKRITELFALPELQGAPPAGDGGADASPDAGAP
jgi:hypothetical protein